MSALCGVHLIDGVNRSTVSGRSVASEFLGFRRGSASKKTRHKPDKPDIAKRESTLRPLGATGAGGRGCGAIGENMARFSERGVSKTSV
jgi:hypothetical protein